MTAAIKTEKLGLLPANKRPAHLLANIDLEIPVGARVGLLGGNGAGKSTLIRLLLGLEPIGEGQAHIFEVPVPTPKSREKIGYLPEQAAPFDYLTGREQLKLFGRLEGLEGEELEQRVEHGLTAANLTHASDLVTLRYSKGMKQRLELERLLLTEKRLLFLDEPMTGLDVEGQLALEDRLLQLAKDEVSMLMTSHEPQILEKVCSHFAILRKGRLIQFGTKQEILSKRGWCIDFEEGALPREVPNGGTVIEDRNGLLFEDRKQAESVLKKLAGSGVIGFGTLLKGVEDVLREVCDHS